MAAASPSSSPPHKRQRLSSSFCDKPFLNSSGDRLALENLDAVISQDRSARILGDHTTSEFSFPPHDEPGNPFIVGPSDVASTPTGSTCFTSALKLPSTVQLSQGSPEPEECPPEPDYSRWFEPVPETTLPPVAFETAASVVSSSSFGIASNSKPSFATASSMLHEESPSMRSPSFQNRSLFMKASNKSIITPSLTALQKAEEQMKLWQEGNPESSRPPLQAIENSAALSVATATTFGRPAVTSASLRIKPGQKPFKSPLLNPNAGAKLSHASSPLNPNSFPNEFTSAASQHPHPDVSRHIIALTSPIKTGVSTHCSPVQPVRTAFSTPVKVSGFVTPGIRNATPGKPKFVTPFKVGMRPGEAGRIALETERTNEKEKAVSAKTVQGKEVMMASSTVVKDHKGWGRWKAFDLSKPPNRKTLKESGLFPQMYTSDELESIGINVSELSQITPTLAMYYSFHTRSSASSLSGSELQPETILGPQAALEELLEKGCRLATKEWVENAWGMILWKLAGMVGLDPEREREGQGEDGRRWCWGEVMRQLLYRYERELNTGSRPPLRLLTTQDAPASSYLVLCVSNVTWSQSGLTEDGLMIDAHPELEVTDGWYKLRAKVDQVLARAVKRGVLRVGRKIGAIGARLESERKEPSEPLAAYNSTRLILGGNSTHLARWHAKLGFQPSPPVATLNSLTPDGGIVPLMEVVVTKVYPVAYIEFVEDTEGKKRREGPRQIREETAAARKWRMRREIEEGKLRDELEKRFARMHGWMERLERKTEGRCKPGEDDSQPDHIQNLFDNLEDAPEVGPFFTRLTTDEAWWLGRFIRDKIEKDRERAGDEIDHELNSICPPREVREFRVLIVRDACTQRRPSHRRAQITVWDVLGLLLSEGSDGGSFQEGQRFKVTNLTPTQQGAWMDREQGSEVYLSTRRDSRWRRIK